MSIFKMMGVLFGVAILTGCSTYATDRYSISASNVVALKKHHVSQISVGEFTAGNSSEASIMCRGVGPIKTPDGENFETFIRNALISEMELADIYSEHGNILLTGNLNSIDFNSSSGYWELSLTVHSSNAESLTVEEKYKYSTSFYGETACNQTAQALMPAVQNLITKLIKNRNFDRLIKA